MGKRYDKKHRLLRTGETERADGYYIYRWTSRDGKRHGITAGALEELREKEDEIRRDVSDGIRADSQNVTVNDLFSLWKNLKRGLKGKAIHTRTTVICIPSLWQKTLVNCLSVK